MKTNLKERKTSRYLFRPTSRYPDQIFSPYGANENLESLNKEQRYSYIVAWQMQEEVEMK